MPLLRRSLRAVLLGRGLGAAGLAVDSATAKGVLRLPLSTLRVGWPVLRKAANRHKAVGLTPKQFHYAFTNTLSEQESAAVYERYHVPGTGHVLFEGALANANRRSAFRVDYGKEDRAPLLFLAGGADDVIPASANRANVKLYRKGIVNYKEFPGRSHHTRAGTAGRGRRLRSRLGPRAHRDPRAARTGQSGASRRQREDRPMNSGGRPMTSTASPAHLPPPGAHEREEIGRELQATLLELVDLSLVGKQLHWSVVGPLFRPLHLQLDELVDSWRDLADTVAERAVAIGFWPDGQAAAVTAGTELARVERGPVEDHAVVRELARRLADVSERTRVRMDRLADLDAASQDVLIEVVRELEQQLWMTRAQLPQGGGG